MNSASCGYVEAGETGGGRSRTGVHDANGNRLRTYSAFFGGLRVASVLETDSSWQDPVVASLFGESSVQYAANGTM